MERNCNQCIYSTRDGGCRNWECTGTETVMEFKKKVVDELSGSIIDHIQKSKPITREEIIHIIQFEADQMNLV